MDSRKSTQAVYIQFVGLHEAVAMWQRLCHDTMQANAKNYTHASAHARAHTHTAVLGTAAPDSTRAMLAC